MYDLTHPCNCSLILSSIYSYPQGQASFLPTILALAGLICSFLMFPPFFRDTQETRNFMCFQTEDPRFESDTNSGCLELRLVDIEYWDDSDDGFRFAPVQVSAVTGILATIGGFVAFFLLLSASCFRLSPAKILTIMIVKLISAFLSLSTILVFIAFNPCKGDENCERSNTTGVRLEKGAVAAIFAMFFYIATAIFVHLYRADVVRQNSRAAHSAAPPPRKRDTHKEHYDGYGNALTNV